MRVAIVQDGYTQNVIEADSAERCREMLGGGAEYIELGEYDALPAPELPRIGPPSEYVL